MYKYKYLKYKKKYLELKKYENGRLKKYLSGGGLLKNYNYVLPDEKDENKINEMNKYLLDKRGWRSKGYTFNQVDNINDANIQVYFKTNDELKKIVNNDKRLINLSITDYSTSPTSIYFNLQNWNNPPKEFKAENNRLSNYRAYLVQHEFGHALGFGHKNKPNKENKMKNCPVMLQQSKYTEPYCKANPWVEYL